MTAIKPRKLDLNLMRVTIFVCAIITAALVLELALYAYGRPFFVTKDSVAMIVAVALLYLVAVLFGMRKLREIKNHIANP